MAQPSTDSEDARLRRAGADLLAGAVIFLISLYVFVVSYRMPYYGDAGLVSSPGLTPALIALAMMVLSAVLVLRSRHFRLPLVGWSGETRRVLTVFGLVFAYVLVMPWIGYVPATFLMVAAFQYIFTSRRGLRAILIWVVGLSAVLTAALWYAFAKIFLIPLP